MDKKTFEEAVNCAKKIKDIEGDIDNVMKLKDYLYGKRANTLIRVFLSIDDNNSNPLNTIHLSKFEIIQLLDSISQRLHQTMQKEENTFKEL